MVVGKERSLPYREDLHSGRLLGQPANMKLGWKGSPGTNALAYMVKSSYEEKMFVNTTLG
jgi:hypothetical protein